MHAFMLCRNSQNENISRSIVISSYLSFDEQLIIIGACIMNRNNMDLFTDDSGYCYFCFYTAHLCLLIELRLNKFTTLS